MYRIDVAGRTLAVRGRRIVARDSHANVTVRLEQGYLYPGFINAHDHLHRNHYARFGDPPYSDAYAWGRDLHARFADDIKQAKRMPRRQSLLFGALKNLLGGVTTVAHHDAWEADFERDFPLRVCRLRVAHSLGLEDDPLPAKFGPSELTDRPFAIHLAEGLPEAVGHEVRRASELGLLGPDTLAVHLTGASDQDVPFLERSGTAVVWCPTSNLFLFDRTAPSTLLAGSSDVLLGTDSLLSGEGTLLDELRAARALGILNDERLLASVSRVAAKRLRLPTPAVEPGFVADFVVLRRPVVEATPADVLLVVVDGRPRLGDAATTAGLFEYGRVPAESLVVGGVEKLVEAPLASVAREMIARVPDCGRVLASDARCHDHASSG